MLAFGCLVGAATGKGGVESLARALVVAVSPARPPPRRPPPASADTGATGSAGGSSAAGGSGSPSPSPSPAAAPVQQTVTVQASPTDTGTSTTSQTTTTTPSTGLLGLPPITHVWEIVLSQQGYNESFVNAKGHPYLATRLRRQGELITDYYGVAASPLANTIALLSGQGPTPQTIGGCPTTTTSPRGRSASSAR